MVFWWSCVRLWRKAEVKFAWLMRISINAHHFLSRIVQMHLMLAAVNLLCIS